MKRKKQKSKRESPDSSPLVASVPLAVADQSTGKGGLGVDEPGFDELGVDISSTDKSSVPPISSHVSIVLSLFVVLHLMALFVSYTSVVEPSGLHNSLRAIAHPYLRTLSFAVDDRPVYLAHGDADEYPLRIEISAQPISRMGGLPDSASDRMSRWLATASLLSQSGQSGLVAELVVSIAQRNPKAKSIRIVRYPTDLSDVNAERESVYVARIIHDGQQIRLVQIQEGRLAASATEHDEGGLGGVKSQAPKVNPE